MQLFHAKKKNVASIVHVAGYFKQLWTQSVKKLLKTFFVI